MTNPSGLGQTSTRVPGGDSRPAAGADLPTGWLQRVRHSNAAVWTATLVSSLASLVASFVLSVDAIRLAENPNAELGCDIVQGFLYAPALPPVAFERWLIEHCAEQARAMLARLDMGTAGRDEVKRSA